MASPPVLFSAVGLSPKDRQAIIVEASTVRNKVTHLLKDGLTSFMQSLILNHRHTKEPFYVLDLGVIDNLMDNWTRSLPMVRPFYAVKCNPDPALLAAMATLDMGFDCASQAEIESILALGVSPGRIIFANPCKLDSHIRYAASVGVNLTTFDIGTEVEKIGEFHPKCSLLIRIKPPDDGGAMWPLDSKFGALPEEVEPLLQAAKAAQLPVIGVSFHIGSRTACSRAYAVAIEAAKKVFEAAARLGMPPMRVLDIGGGFTAGIQFEEAASTIRAALKTYFPDTTGMSIIAEPGRFFVESAFTLAANIIGKRVRGELREYWINDGVYGSLMCGALFEPKILTCKPLACNSNRENPTCEGALTSYSSTVFGPTLDALDTVMKGHGLPELEVNDWLVFPNMGAYSSALRSNFNGFNTSAFSTYLAYSNPG